MSNTLYITVTQFTDLKTGNTRFGYIATDSDDSDYNDGFDTLADFHDEFEDAESLETHVKGSSKFCFLPDDTFTIVEWA
jgi:hypothetical protein